MAFQTHSCGFWNLIAIERGKMKNDLDSETTKENRSHFKRGSSFKSQLTAIRKKIISRGDLPNVSLKTQLELLKQLSEFPFGRYLLERRGANGFWTDFLIFHPDRKFAAETGNNGDIANTVEDFIFNRSLIVLAHRERVSIFQKLIQERIKEGIVLASIPCGVMRDLLTLNFASISNFRIVGLDIDKESLDLAKNLANERGITNVDFFQQDAWQMKNLNEFDVIASSGLNVYESNSKKLLDLYSKFFTALKPGGSLVISVLTYPPGESKKTDWKLDGILSKDLLMENILYRDILGLHWRNFRSIDELDREFKHVGFSKISIHFDKHQIFPTILATK